MQLGTLLKELRLLVLNVPKHQESELPLYDLTKIRLESEAIKLKLKEKILLGVLLWYFPEEIKSTVWLWLDEHWGPNEREVKEVLLTSKSWALGYILVQDKWSDNDFFGNILVKSTIKFLLRFERDPKAFFVRFSNKKVKKYTGWCRGHQDVRRNPLSKDPNKYITDTLAQKLSLEAELQFLQKLSDLKESVEKRLEQEAI
jgi:hypothetical protein